AFVDMAVSAFSELSYFKALSLSELGKTAEARELLLRIKEYAEQKLNEEVKIDYFATSLPLLLVFDDDLQKRNEWEAKYLIGIAELGLGNKKAAMKYFEQVIQINAMHVGA